MALQARLPLPVYGNPTTRERRKGQRGEGGWMKGECIRICSLAFSVEFSVNSFISTWIYNYAKLLLNGFWLAVGFVLRLQRVVPRQRGEEGEGISGAFRLDSFMHISCICHWQHQQQPHYLAFNKPLGSRSRCTSTATGAVPPPFPLSSVPAPLPIVNSSCCCCWKLAAKRRCQGA